MEAERNLVSAFRLTEVPNESFELGIWGICTKAHHKRTYEFCVKHFSLYANIYRRDHRANLCCYIGKIIQKWITKVYDYYLQFLLDSPHGLWHMKEGFIIYVQNLSLISEKALTITLKEVIKVRHLSNMSVSVRFKQLSTTSQAMSLSFVGPDQVHFSRRTSLAPLPVRCSRVPKKKNTHTHIHTRDKCLS